MKEHVDLKVNAEAFWHHYMTTGEPPKWLNPPWYRSRSFQLLFRHLPASPRCHLCASPFKGVGGRFMRILGVVPSQLNPQFCNTCEWIAENFQGGAEVESTLLFADVRGSTGLAEKLNPAEFSRLINRFYDVATTALIQTNGMVEKLVGDEVTGFYVPGFSGPQHAQAAIKAARQILRATGHGTRDGSWLPVGVGIHTGTIYVGAVRSDAGVCGIAVLGDAANVGARLAGQAGQGEILVSEGARVCAGLERGKMEMRQLHLKGRTESVDAWVVLD
jgi:adenylate cyclase